MPEPSKIKLVVFAASLHCQYVLASLAQQQMLAGVIMPDPSELGELAMEANNLATQLKQAGIPFQCCCQAKLPLIHQQLQTWQVNLGVILGYPHILPTELLDYFDLQRSLGLYNLHASKLPQYPGPSPLYWQIRNREQATDLVLHRVEQRVDSGNLVASKTVPIAELDTLPSLSNRIAGEMPSLVQQLLEALLATGKPPQDIAQHPTSLSDAANKPAITNARRPTGQDYQVDFSTMNAEQISAMCRAGNSLPYSALIQINNVPINLIQATPVDLPTYGTEPGTIIFIGDPEGLIVCVKDGALRLDILAGADGVFSGQALAEYFRLDAGTRLASPSPLLQQA